MRSLGLMLIIELAKAAVGLKYLVNHSIIKFMVNMN
jgi:hypothetical protein